MHGIKREEYERRHQEEEEAAEDRTRSRYLQLCQLTLNQEQPVTLDILDELLVLNPEYYPAWNRRKDLLLSQQHLLPDRLASELEFNVRTLRASPKSYAAWHHRKWLLQRGAGATIFAAVCQNELALCARLLTEHDGRNFHCWNYRAFIVDQQLAFISDDSIHDGLGGDDDGHRGNRNESDKRERKGDIIDRELAFAQSLIDRDFGNYSAWHRRAHLIAEHVKDEDRRRSLMAGDVDLVLRAVWTDPEDHSAWLYLRGLLLPRLLVNDLETLRTCLLSVDQLLQEEPDCSGITRRRPWTIFL
jgi:geranylgeranyl transferase type-2 subunit alpha